MTNGFTALAAAAALMLAAGAAAAEEVSAEAQAKIDALLAELDCQLNGEIEVEDDGYELDDVFCSDGVQYDIALDEAFNVTERRAE